MRTARRLATLLLSTVLGQLGVQAQTDSSTTLTRDDLRSCIQQEVTLRSKSEAQQAEASRSNEEAASIAAESANLIRASVNGFKDKAARDAHASKSSNMNKRVDTFNTKSRQVRLALADIQTLQSEYLRKCGGKSFYQEDKNAILAEREPTKAGARAIEAAASGTQPN